MRKFTDLNLNTNLLFFINGLLYMDIGEYICGFSMLGSSICAYMYHYYHESNDFWKSLDIIFATNALIITLYFSIPHLKWQNLIELIILGVACGITKFIANNDYKWHWLWHIFVFIGQCYLYLLMR